MSANCNLCEETFMAQLMAGSLHPGGPELTAKALHLIV